MFVNWDTEGEKGDVEIGKKPRRVTTVAILPTYNTKKSDEHKASNFYLLNKSTARKRKWSKQ